MPRLRVVQGSAGGFGAIAPRILASREPDGICYAPAFAEAS